MDNYNIENQKSQSILEKMQDRMKHKEQLLPYLSIVYKSGKEDLTGERLEKKIQNLKNCATELMIHDETGQITGANFCKHRLCPVCNYRRSTMLWHKVNSVISEIKTDFLLITLTVRNCSAEKLQENIDSILESFHRITSRRKWKEYFKGFIRGLEITYNAQEDTFHPHLHILVATDSAYFKEKYLDVHTLRTWWTESARLDYYVQVDIRKVKNPENAIAEVVKYAVKTADILENGQDEKRIKATQTLYNAISNRRLMSTGGNIKKMARIKKINLDDDALEDVHQKRNNSRWYKYQNGKYTVNNF